jgi:hypothetical protein
MRFGPASKPDANASRRRAELTQGRTLRRRRRSYD